MENNWDGGGEPRDNPYYDQGAGRRMDGQGKYGCLPWLLAGLFVVLAVLLVGVQIGMAVVGS